MTSVGDHMTSVGDHMTSVGDHMTSIYLKGTGNVRSSPVYSKNVQQL